MLRQTPVINTLVFFFETILPIESIGQKKYEYQEQNNVNRFQLFIQISS